MEILGKSSLAFLETYINNCAPLGAEMKGQEIWLDRVKGYSDEITQDIYGNSARILNPDGKLRVAISAHADVVSWMVSQVTKKGFLYVVPNGGTDPVSAPAMEVVVHSKEGSIPGIFGWPAIHIRKDKKNLIPDKEHLFIDCGFSGR